MGVSTRRLRSVHNSKVKIFRGCLHDPALLGCNEAWDRFDVLNIAITCGTCFSKIVSQ